jgi:hypothetical protein
MVEVSFSFDFNSVKKFQYPLCWTGVRTHMWVKFSGCLLRVGKW